MPWQKFTSTFSVFLYWFFTYSIYSCHRPAQHFQGKRYNWHFTYRNSSWDHAGVVYWLVSCVCEWISILDESFKQTSHLFTSLHSAFCDKFPAFIDGLAEEKVLQCKMNWKHWTNEASDDRHEEGICSFACESILFTTGRKGTKELCKLTIIWYF